jgi:hypothetical protein
MIYIYTIIHGFLFTIYNYILHPSILFIIIYFSYQFCGVATLAINHKEI